MPKVLTEAQKIQKSYDSSLSSVRLIEKLILGVKTNAAKDEVSRNVEHLKLMVAKTNWTTEQALTPLNNAISAGEAWVSQP